jgi:hypothetical protein
MEKKSTEEKPEKLITRIVEFALLFALSAFLIRLGVRYILEIWWVLLILGIAAAGAVILWRIRKNKAKW